MNTLLRHTRRNRGFTLIELLVVILIIAILIAVAAPSFLGQQDKARDSEAKQQLTVLYKAAKADSIDQSDTQGAFRTGTALVDALEEAEPQLADALADAPLGAGVGTPATNGEIAVCAASSAAELRLVARSDSGTTFLLVSNRSSFSPAVPGDCAGPADS